MRCWLRLLFFSLAIGTIASGCSSLVANAIGLQTGHPTPFVGVKSDINTFSENLTGPPTVRKALDGSLALIEAPFSAALDTLLLPLVIPQYLENVEQANQPSIPRDPEADARASDVMHLQQKHLRWTIENGAPLTLIDGIPQQPHQAPSPGAPVVD